MMQVTGSCGKHGKHGKHGRHAAGAELIEESNHGRYKGGGGKTPYARRPQRWATLYEPCDPNRRGGDQGLRRPIRPATVPSRRRSGKEHTIRVIGGERLAHR